jgi:hypothetical protein
MSNLKHYNNSPFCLCCHKTKSIARKFPQVLILHDICPACTTCARLVCDNTNKKRKYNGAIQVDGPYYIHVGQFDPATNAEGNNGCIAVCNYNVFRQMIVKLTGAKDVKSAVQNRLIKVHYLKSNLPPFVPIPKTPKQ